MADKYPVSIYGRPNGFIRAEEGATAGATLGVDLRDAGGNLLIDPITQTITNGDITHSPSGDAVFDALAGKEPAIAAGSEGQFIRGDKVPSTILNTTISPGLTINRTNNSVNALNAIQATGGTMYFGQGAAMTFNVGSSNNLSLASNQWLRVDGTTVGAGTDNTISSFEAARRCSVVYSATGVINTSDARDKSVRGTLNVQELAAAKELANAAVIFQWNDAIAEKGPDARLHCSPTVQSVISIMESHGLDPFRYGFVCYDSWGEIPMVVEEETGEVLQSYQPAGDRYSLRPAELSFFISVGVAQLISSLEGRLTALETA
ncbi:MAG TPA: tail fiber domain-containing protein [Candidatus Obscuribacterales bacterium]